MTGMDYETTTVEGSAWHAAQHDRPLPGPAPSRDEMAVRLAAALGQRCESCGVDVGRACVDQDGTVMVGRAHLLRYPPETDERVRACRRARALEFQASIARAAA